MVELRPRRAKAAGPAETAKAEETPKAKPKTPKASKRKATEDVSPTATKKAKSVKTPAKSKDTEESAKQEFETPKTKKGKTPVKAKDIEKAVPEETEKTPASRSKKDKTPAKAKATEDEALKETEKTPAAKSKKEKTPAKPKEREAATPKEAETTPASKSKKEKTPAKAKVAKDTPSKIVEQPTPKTTTETSAKAKGTPKAVSTASEQTPVSKAKDEKTPKKTPKSAKKPAKKTEPEVEPAVEMGANAEDVEEDVAAPQADEPSFSEDEVDDQTKALIQTIDSGDEGGPGSGVILFEQGQDVGKIPEVAKKEKKAAKKALAALKDKEDTGVVYIGRLPHGFYEHEMKSYFSQFGPIRNLRVSRNKKTGKAKHFAFVEFEDASTAEIVAKTMDNYLLFGHILKCSVVPKAQVHAELFKGANKRFRPVPWNKMEGKQMERPMLEDQWARKAKKENKRRAERAKKLQSLGYDFDAPKVKSYDATTAITAPEAGEDSSVKLIEEAATTEIDAPPAADAVAAEVAEKEQEATPKPAKRGRGRPAKTPQKASKTAETPRKTRKAKA